MSDSGTEFEPGQYPTAQFDHVVSAVRELKHPTQIGPYHILSLIGEGGMGTVYRAQQREPIHRVVAIKIIKLGMDTAQVIARFESERQALAVMSHANVAQVLDAGATETGRPYFVMEYVAGEPITTFSDRQKLTLRQRLELFMQACDAVQHAHQKAIIHRDLKPSNILVTLQDGKPLLKVIDFGVAKALSQRLTEKTLFTEAGQLVGTPEYMAPEQADGPRGLGDVDTRSDVYSLGVVLYELLSGSLPFDPQTLRSAAYAEIQRIIRDVDPPRPSTRLSSLGNDAQRVAQLRCTPLDSLQRQLKSELEWIPLKAMRKDRTQRYATPVELSEDIANYLAQRPLRAGPESAAYRARKFFRRNQRGVAASAAMLVLLVCGIVATTWQAVRATRAERRTRDALQDAQLANAEAQAVNEFLTQDLLRSADPKIARGEKITVEQALNAAAGKVGQKFRDLPRVEASVRHTLAETYNAVGRADLGLPQARRALEICQSALGADDPSTLDSMNSLAVVLLSLGRLDEAGPLCRDALERAHRVLGNKHRTTETALTNMAQILFEQGKITEAEQSYRESLSVSRELYPPDDPEVLKSINNLATVLLTQGRFAEAEPLFRELVTAQRRVLPENHPEIAVGLSHLAMTCQRIGKFEEAETLHRESLLLSRLVLGDDHPDTLRQTFNLAGLLEQTGKLDEAETMLRAALEVSRSKLSDDHPQTIGAINNLAALLKKKGEMDESIGLSREAVERFRRILGDDHPHTILAMNNLANALHANGNLSEAEPLFAEVYRRAPNSQIDPKTAAMIMSRWGPCLVELGRYDDAEAPLRAAHERLHATGQAASPAMTSVLRSLAKVCERSDREQEAVLLRAELAAATQPATHKR